MINVVIADDHPIFLEGISSIIETRFQDINIVAMARNGHEAVEAYRVYKPDVIVLDINMPEMDGVEAARQIRGLDDNAKILMLTTFDEQHQIEELFKSGVNGYVLKETPIEEVIMDIRLVYRGQTAMNNEIMKKLYTPVKRIELQPYTPEKDERTDSKSLMAKIHTHPLLRLMGTREKQIFLMIIQGLNNGEISEKLNLSDGTIRNYVHTIYESIDVHKRSGVIIWAIEQGFL